MVSGKHRSRTKRRVYVKSSTCTKIHYRKRNHNRAQCRICGAVLKGVPNVRAFKLKSMCKSKKRPQRPFGGNLCSRCMRAEIKMIARLS